jgi:N-acetylglucosaminyldiphosphoundecaprenol N-acetyl-beta-D-mannosaminyltransferase
VGQVRVSILGVPIDAVTQDEAVLRVREFLTDGHQHHVMTPNPEMLVKATKDLYFLGVLQRTALNIPDGIGLLFAARMLGKRLPARVTGIDLLMRVASLPEINPVFLLGAAPGVAERAAEALKRQCPSLEVVGTYAGSPALREEDDIIRRINASGARSLFVAFGAPVQDLWIDWNLKRMPNVAVAMGVGGSFDFLAGVQKRAPQLLRSTGLEWAWRLLCEPSRWRRIITATVVFPLLVLRAKFQGRS